MSPGLSTRKIPFIDLRAQYEAHRSEIDAAIARVVNSAGYIQGPEVAALEGELSAYAGTSHCISCSSGTDALYIALLALEIGPGDEVIVPAFSFFATAEVVSLVGATPVFVDIEPTSYTISAATLEGSISKRTKAIIPVGLYGQPPQMDPINQIAEANGISVIEDAAQSFGAESAGLKSCNLSAIGCTSFYPAKPLGCYGDGGAIFTSDTELGERMRRIMNHGQISGYNHAEIGINGRLDAIQAAVLRVHLAHFDEDVHRRQRIARRYDQLLADLPWIELPRLRPDATSVYAQYTIALERRDDLRAFLDARGVPTAVHYPLPIYRQPAYRKLGVDAIADNSTRCVHAERAAGRVVSLPFGPYLTEDDQDSIVDAIHAFR